MTADPTNSGSVLGKRIGFQLLQTNLQFADVRIHRKYVVVENLDLALDSPKAGVKLGSQFFLTLAQLFLTVAQPLEAFAQFFLPSLNGSQLVCEPLAPLVQAAKKGLNRWRSGHFV